MSVQQFCLRWNNHQPNFISVFSSLLHNETLVDVTLAADGSQLQAHKVVLSACSTYFESLFTSNPCRHPIVILKDVRYSDLKTLVDFMYYGEVNVSQERLPHIIKTAEMLKIKGLAEMSDAASLSKSESKSSSSDTETLTTNVIVNDDGESPWRTSHTQHSLLHRQQVTQSTGASQQQQQQQQQASQQAAHIHSRRTPSPATMSPAARRKRLRKSSTGMPEYPIRKEHYVTDDDFRPGSGSVSAAERTSGEEHSNLEGGPSGASAIHMQHMDPMSSFATASNLTSTISNARIIKDSPSSDTEQPQHETSQESVDEQGSVQHHSIVVKTDSDLDHVSQPMPLDITGSSSSGPSVSQPQSQHSGVQWTVVESTYPPRFTLSSCPTNLGMSGASHSHPDGGHQQQGGGNGGSGNSTSQPSGTASGGSAGGSGESTGASSSSVHMTQYQGSAYPTQIISVNNYSQPLSTPTSPQGESSLVQSVYSQGTTPNQSPIDTKPPVQQQPPAPTPAPQKRKRSVNPQGDENFIRALEAVRYGGIGFCKAARLFGVNNRTLWLEYKKRGYPISRPSIKSRIKLEPNVSPQPPATPTNEENTMENYEHIAQPSINMPISSSTTAATPETPTSAPIMCPPHAHPMGVMSFLDTRHVEFPSVHPMARQRYPDTPVNVNPSAMNLQGLNFNTM
ncbi:longitudinals lacking protein, isoforms H/M/V isoform X1 [Phlebotomus argentipes]|uniref:longitudinals lacking protein, isoforms H/M/V isoform X1 n=1 Tax=Phlebotomus argentipes TaxID=94469 RepID=UPI002892D565|nr:longitudinals lacking protein, isoforms H/M/V isoform X1 [Phlebotomus argentipes]XP_059615704.1 longitudinals lacking protein, isoforms H/M/V isoform X1 [Phlebotomus argentipes]